MARRWSTPEDRLLRRLYLDGLPVRDIAAQLGRSPDAIVARRPALGIPPRRAWTPDEDGLVRAAAAAGISARVLAHRLGRSPDQVRARRRTLVGRTRSPGRPYLPHEDDAIRGSVGNGDLSALADRLGRTPDALRLRAHTLGVHAPSRRRRWTDWEDAVVRDGYTSALGCVAIARQLPDRSAGSVAARARKLGIVSYARRWDAADERRLMVLTAAGCALEDVAEQLGRTPEAIRRRAGHMGIASPRPAAAPRRGAPWTPREDDLLRLHHALNPARLAQLLGRSDRAVCRRLDRLGLRAAASRSPHHPIGRRDGAVRQLSPSDTPAASVPGGHDPPPWPWRRARAQA